MRKDSDSTAEVRVLHHFPATAARCGVIGLFKSGVVWDFGSKNTRYIITAQSSHLVLSQY